ncbi:MAG: hypothetical protein KDD20_04385 [Mangrovimonas sp.]|nr:hypothetical protein [Mangrovimonas sp.]MCB0437958.1 hypothetical protein [Mangrovimonas sp.]
MNKLFNLKSLSTFSFFLVATLVLQTCGSAKSVDSGYITTGPAVSYETDISPMMTRSCAPCHFPEEGKKQPLNTLESVKEHIDDILVRVQLPESNFKYMPFKSKKPALTADEITMLKRWAGQGFPK